MRCHSLRALAAHALFILTPARLAYAQGDATTTTTLTSTVSLTLTTTITASGGTYTSTFASLTTETTTAGQTAIAGDRSSSQPTTGDAMSSFSGQAFETAILNSTNYYRAQHQANPLSWDSNLAQYAQNYAQRCIWQHSGSPYGENLAAGYASPTLAINAWASEEKDYNYEKAHFTEKAGHYTQLVWQNTTAVGCGAVQCSNAASNGVKGWYVVCEYSPRGNVVGAFRQEVLKTGEGKDGEPGFGSAASVRGGRRLWAALVAAYVFLALLV